MRGKWDNKVKRSRKEKLDEQARSVRVEKVGGGVEELGYWALVLGELFTYLHVLGGLLSLSESVDRFRSMTCD